MPGEKIIRRWAFAIVSFPIAAAQPERPIKVGPATIIIPGECSSIPRPLPVIIPAQGERASLRFIEFFIAANMVRRAKRLTAP